jgi:hypothetical protein
MAWAEVRQGHWQRPIGENEAMIKMIGDKGHDSGKDTWSIAATACFTAHLKTKPLSEALRNGWKTFRFHHPSIASIASEDILEYHIPEIHELEKWADETFFVLHDDVGLDDIISKLEPRRYATCYYLEECQSVLLYISHWRTDGIGAFHLLGAFFEAAIESLNKEPLELPWGQEAAQLVPSVEEALGLPHAPSADIERATMEYVRTLSNNIGALETPFASGNGINPSFTGGAHLRFSKDQSTDIVNACNRLGIRLEAALHASVAATAYSVALPSSRHKHHASTLRHSIRPHLPPPYDGVAGAAGLYTAGYIVKVPPSQPWLENAKQYNAEYSKGATPDLLCSRRQYALTMKKILQNALVPDPPPSGLDISYVPNAQELVRPVYERAGDAFEILQVGLGVEVVSRHVYVFAWMFDGRLDMRLVYNQAFYDGGFAEKVLSLVKEHMLSNLLS